MKDGVQAITTELEKGAADLPPCVGGEIAIHWTGEHEGAAPGDRRGGRRLERKNHHARYHCGNPCPEHPLRPEGGGPLHHRPDPAAGEEKEIRLQTIDEMVEAIRALRVRGAPGHRHLRRLLQYVLAKSIRTEDRPTFLKRLSDYGQQLDAAVPRR